MFGARDLRHLFVDPLHRPAVADDVGEVVALLELLPQVRVLVDEPPVLRRDEPLHLHRLPDHRATTLKNARDRSKLRSALNFRFTPRAPTTLRSKPMGTQMKLDSSSCASSLRPRHGTRVSAPS